MTILKKRYIKSSIGKNILLVLSPFIIYFVALFLTNWKHNYTFPLFIISIYLLGLFIKSKAEVLLVGFPFFIISTIEPFLGGKPLIFVLILYTIFFPLSLVFSFFLKNKNIVIKSIFPIGVLVFSIFGFMEYLEYGRGFNSQIDRTAPEIKLISQQKDTLYINSIKDKVIVLDFWTTSCGICFKKFPSFEEVSIAFNDNPNVIFFSVNIPIKKEETIESNIEFSKVNVNYKFENLFSESSILADNLGIKAYPHLVILKNGKIRYSGRLVLNSKIHNTKSEIIKLLKKD